jgi:hypothetical protein
MKPNFSDPLSGIETFIISDLNPKSTLVLVTRAGMVPYTFSAVLGRVKEPDRKLVGRDQ